ncbi:hypothetical protein ABBQ38_014556 [Trebouxia sp. C0009 RCD-2024]
MSLLHLGLGGLFKTIRVKPGVMSKGTSINQKQRQEAIVLKKYHPDWTFSKIGRKIGCSRSFVRRWVQRDQAGEPQHDQPRTGRPAKFDSAVQKYIVKAARLQKCYRYCSQASADSSADFECLDSEPCSQAEWLTVL